MLAIDLTGLLATFFLVGPRYPHYVLLATCIYELGRIFIAVFLHGQIDYIIAAGAFGTISVSTTNPNAIGILFIFSGSIISYIVSSIMGGIAFESTANLLNPFANVKSPFTVVNFRLCILSCLIQIWRNYI